VQGEIVNIFAIPPAISQKCNIKYCPSCYQKGQLTEGVIDRGTSMYCAKHYRIHSSRNRALSRGLYAPHAQELESMIPSDMKCRVCAVTMVHSVREGSRNDIMSLQHWRNGTIEWICLRCNSSHGTTSEPDDKWVELVRTVKENEKYCNQCKTIKDLAFFYNTPNGSKGKSSYCQVCHDAYTNKRDLTQKD
jgi:hypothetical protein